MVVQCHGAGLGARAGSVHAHADGVAGGAREQPVHGPAAAGCAAVGTQAGIQIFAESPRSSGVGHRQRSAVAAAHALVAHRHRGRCRGTHSRVESRRTRTQNNVEFLIGNVVKVAAQVDGLVDQRRQGARSRSKETHVLCAASTGRCPGVVVASNGGAARQACVADEAAVHAGLNGAAQGRPGSATVADVDSVVVGADAHVADGQGRVGCSAVGDANAADELRRVATRQDLPRTDDVGAAVEAVTAAAVGVGVVVGDGDVAGAQTQATGGRPVVCERAHGAVGTHGEGSRGGDERGARTTEAQVGVDQAAVGGQRARVGQCAVQDEPARCCGLHQATCGVLHATSHVGC